MWLILKQDIFINYLVILKYKNQLKVYILNSFNELILPDYESCEKLHQSLKVAITEGVVGFELS